MARQIIDTTTNNGTYIGDPAKTAFDKVNSNFAEVYSDTVASIKKVDGRVVETLNVRPLGASSIATGQTATVISGTISAIANDSVNIEGYKRSAGGSESLDWLINRRLGSNLGAVIFMPGTNTGPTAGGISFGYGASGQWGVYSVNGSLFPTSDNLYAFGTPAYRCTVVYSSTGSINTSDAREKTSVSNLGDSEILASIDMVKEIGVFKFLASVAAKGDNARMHVGMTVQRAIEIMEAHGLNALDYSFICHDEWSDDGVKKDRYGFRIDGLIMFMMAGIDNRLSRLEGAF